ncbi:hypothetical protein [Streptomyces chartreusis]|uniref:hypothetical protein n=1 Tax=Streptomyces chartreusis TaxID=1969 RepID=UPI0033BEAE16
MPAIGLVPVRVFTYPGHGSFGPDAHRGAGQNRDAALPAAVRSPERGHGGIVGNTAVPAKLDEHQAVAPRFPGGFRPSVGAVLPIVSVHIGPVVVNFEKYIVTRQHGTVLERWPVDASGSSEGRPGRESPPRSASPQFTMKEGLS